MKDKKKNSNEMNEDTNYINESHENINYNIATSLDSFKFSTSLLFCLLNKLYSCNYKPKYPLMKSLNQAF